MFNVMKAQCDKYHHDTYMIKPTAQKDTVNYILQNMSTIQDFAT